MTIPLEQASRFVVRGALLALACIGIGACSALPTQGPDAEVVVSARPANPDKVQYVLVDLTPSIVARVRQEPAQTLGGVFTGRGGAPDLKLGVGDVVAVTIFEAASGGLFIPSEAGARAGNFVNIPNQEIGKDGTIEVPYAGSVQAPPARAGRKIRVTRPTSRSSGAGARGRSISTGSSTSRATTSTCGPATASS